MRRRRGKKWLRLRQRAGSKTNIDTVVGADIAEIGEIAAEMTTVTIGRICREPRGEIANPNTTSREETTEEATMIRGKIVGGAIAETTTVAEEIETTEINSTSNAVIEIVASVILALQLKVARIIRIAATATDNPK